MNGPINTSLFIAALVSFCVGLLATVLLHVVMWTIGVPNNWPIFSAKMVLLLTVAVVYFIACLQPITKVKHRGVAYLLGKRVRVGPEDKGYVEGLNATPLPKSIMTVEDVDVREQRLDLDNVDEFTTNDIIASANSAANWRIKDPYIWLEIEEGQESTKDLLLRTFRDAMMKFRSHAVRNPDGSVKIGGIIDEDKAKLGEEIKKLVNAALMDNRVNPDKNTLLTDEVVEVVSVQIRKMDLPTETKTELQKRENEWIQRDGERIQAESRATQADILQQGGGVSREYALAVTLSDAGKPGVNINQHGIGQSIADVVNNLATTLTNAVVGINKSGTGSKPPAGP